MESNKKIEGYAKEFKENIANSPLKAYEIFNDNKDLINHLSDEDLDYAYLVLSSKDVTKSREFCQYINDHRDSNGKFKDYLSHFRSLDVFSNFGSMMSEDYYEETGL